jgi:hypothetical protein
MKQNKQYLGSFRVGLKTHSEKSGCTMEGQLCSSSRVREEGKGEKLR